MPNVTNFLWATFSFSMTLLNFWQGFAQPPPDKKWAKHSSVKWWTTFLFYLLLVVYGQNKPDSFWLVKKFLKFKNWFHKKMRNKLFLKYPTYRVIKSSDSLWGISDSLCDLNFLKYFYQKNFFGNYSNTQRGHNTVLTVGSSK